MFGPRDTQREPAPAGLTFLTPFSASAVTMVLQTKGLVCKDKPFCLI